MALATNNGEDAFYYNSSNNINTSNVGRRKTSTQSSSMENNERPMASAASRVSFGGAGATMGSARSVFGEEAKQEQKVMVSMLAQEIEEEWPSDNPYAQPFHSLLEVQLRMEAKLEAFLKKKLPSRPRKAPPSFHLDFFETPQRQSRRESVSGEQPDNTVPDEGGLPRGTLDKRGAAYTAKGLTTMPCSPAAGPGPPPDPHAYSPSPHASPSSPSPTSPRTKAMTMPPAARAVAAAVAAATKSTVADFNEAQQQQQQQQQRRAGLQPPVAPEPKYGQDNEVKEEDPRSNESIENLVPQQTTPSGLAVPLQPRHDRPLKSLSVTSSHKADRSSRAASVPSSSREDNRGSAGMPFRRGKSNSSRSQGSGLRSRFAVQDEPEAEKTSARIAAFHNIHHHDDDSECDSLDEASRRRKTVAGTIIFPPNHGEGWLKMLVNNTFFELLSGIIIVTNAVFIGYETQYLAVHGASTSPYANLNVAFSLYFIVELVLRLAAYRGYFFTNTDYRWNCLDFAMVLTSLVDLFFAFNTSLESAGRSLRHVRLFRLARTIRIVRTLKAVREFHKMVYALLSSLRTLMCSLLILFFVMYFFAIIFCQAVSDTELDSDNPENLAVLKEYYEDLPRSFYALFMSATNGISWTQVHEPLAQLHWVYGACFLAYVAMIFFGVMNVVTSVFVESAIMSAQHYKDLIIQEKQHEKDIAMSHMKQVFEQIDEDGSGEITIDEMEVFLQQTHLKKYMEALNISAQDTRMLFRLLDRDGSRKIDINEFSEGCLRLQGDAKSFDIHSMIFTIKQFLGKWSEFTDYVEDCFERLFPFDDEDEDVLRSTSMTPDPSLSPRRGPGSVWMAGAMSKVASMAPPTTNNSNNPNNNNNNNPNTNNNPNATLDL